MAMHGLGINRQILENQKAILTALGIVLANTMKHQTEGHVKTIMDNCLDHIGRIEETLKTDDKETKAFQESINTSKVYDTKYYDEDPKLPKGQIAVWESFAKDVQEHIGKYVITQYGDIPNDQISEYGLDEYRANLNRYVGRIGRGARGKTEALRDCLKIAHYASRMYDFLMKEEKE